MNVRLFYLIFWALLSLANYVLSLKSALNSQSPSAVLGYLLVFSFCFIATIHQYNKYVKQN
jgi:hypothetical protein